MKIFTNAKGSIRLMLAGLSLAALLVCMARGGDERVSARQLPESDFEPKPASVATTTMIPHGDNSEQGISVDKGTASVALGKRTRTISVTNDNGTIQFRQGNVKNIEVRTTVVIHHATAEEAKAIADKAGLQVKQETTLMIKAVSRPYGQDNRYTPTIHLAITLPQDMKPDLHANLKNGILSLSKVSGTGKIELTTQNGNITAIGIGSDITLQTINGEVQVSDAKKNVLASTTNGNIEADRISGRLGMEATNGNLTAHSAFSSIRAVTVAGNISIESGKVGGDWNVSSSAGNVDLAWPEKAGVKVDGSTVFGKIEAEFPLEVKNSSVSGTIGSGSYRISVQSMAGLSLLKSS